MRDCRRGGRFRQEQQQGFAIDFSRKISAASVAATALALLIGCDRAPPAVEPGVTLELATWRAATIRDLRYRPHFVVPEQRDAPIRGNIAIAFDLDDAAAPLQLDFRESADRIVRVAVNGAESGYEFADEHIVVPASSLRRGDNEIVIDFVAGDTSLNRNPEFLYTLFVPDRARTAFPLFDQPNLKAVFELTLTVPPEWTALSNTPLVAATETDVGIEYRFAPSRPLPSYLFSFVAGRFETITAERGGRTMTMLHRETDAEKVARNADEIFDLHAGALDWLERYTGIDYPWQKFDFALIPAFQYGGMEHVGAIQYRDTSLFLDESPSDTQLLGRASLIAHETAHMWFGNLVTMAWFDDVWTKEVFASFMAGKIVNPAFPDVDHDLNFLLRHFPSAYSVDRTSGANAIRQYLPNLNLAGQMYGEIIYNKAPIMMRQLELLIGEEAFREGIREYLERFAYDNARWPDLIAILDEHTPANLGRWSTIWVETPGRPVFDWSRDEDDGTIVLRQIDRLGNWRVWPQRFEIAGYDRERRYSIEVLTDARQEPLDASEVFDADTIVFSADGTGYGLFPAADVDLATWQRMTDVERAATLINRFENLLPRGEPTAFAHFETLRSLIPVIDNELMLNLVFEQLRPVYWVLLPPAVREDVAADLESQIWERMLAVGESSTRKMLFAAYADVSLTPEAVQRVYDVWSGALTVDDLPLSENDFIELSQMLAIKLPSRADQIVSTQLAMTENPDSRRKLVFIAPSTSGDERVRERFFFSLRNEENRQTETWVLDAVRNLHHPLRTAHSEQFIVDSLLLLEEIQRTGDIFFPKRWLDETLGNHRSATAVQAVRAFLDERPEYNRQLRMKILQSADMMLRANTLIDRDHSD